MLKKPDSLLNNLERVLEIIAMVSLLGFMLLGTANVLGRDIFNSPIIGAIEFSQILMAGSFLLALASTQAQKQHIAVTDLLNRFPPNWRSILEFAALFIGLILFGVMTWLSAKLVNTLWIQGEQIPTVRIPVAPFRILLPLGAFVLCLELIRQMAHLIIDMKKRGN
jgi:TRAP-type C4-dicarboxylate transport system permease small subunit